VTALRTSLALLGGAAVAVIVGLVSGVGPLVAFGSIVAPLVLIVLGASAGRGLDRRVAVSVGGTFVSLSAAAAALTWWRPTGLAALALLFGAVWALPLVLTAFAFACDRGPAGDGERHPRGWDAEDGW